VPQQKNYKSPLKRRALSVLLCGDRPQLQRQRMMGAEAVTDDDFPTTAMRQKAGHQEILGETLAKFEFFQKGWHPYSRFLDIDKVDLILRRRLADKIVYREVQVKFGKLHTSMSAWEHKLFTCSS
jgi:hypothetical protein